MHQIVCLLLSQLRSMSHTRNWCDMILAARLFVNALSSRETGYSSHHVHNYKVLGEIVKVHKQFQTSNVIVY